MPNYADYIEKQQENGVYIFSKENLIAFTQTKEPSLRVTLARNIQEKNLIYLGKKHYLIIPKEYKRFGAPPPEWYIDTMMKAYKTNYYVGLLTAASFYGASHQSPQVFQALISRDIRLNRNIGQATIRCHYSHNCHYLPTREINTPTGYMIVSTPEVTAFDLVKFMKESGHINHVATVLEELSDQIDAQKLADVSSYYAPVFGQRLGYILDTLLQSEKTHLLYQVINEKKLRYSLLRSDGPQEVFIKDKKWHILINEKIEADL